MSIPPICNQLSRMVGEKCPVHGDVPCTRKPEPRTPREVRAVLYAQAYAQMVPAAKACGYALALHGSMTRDLDVVAVPWVEKVSSPQDLAQALANAIGWDLANGHGSPGWKPHGRLAITIVDHETGLWVDLSVMPSQTSKPLEGSHG